MKLQFSINPVTLKELRQLVRSRLILWGMAVLPIVLLVTTAIVLSSEMHDMSPMEVTYGKGLGGGPLIAVAVITGIVTCGLIPLFTSIKTAIETSKTSLGLEFTTALTSAQIATGKITAAAIISAIAVALAMPFFVLSYLMRGVELASTVIVPVSLLAAGVVTSSLGLLPACSRRSIAMKIVILVALYTVLPIFVLSTSAIMSVGGLLGGAPSGLSFVGVFFTVFVPAAIVAYCRAQTAAELAPPHTDFDRSLRFTQIALFASGIPLLFAGMDAAIAWGVIWAMVAGMVAIGAAARPAPLTRGAMNNAPRALPLRVLAFPVATGSTPAMFFALALAVAAVAVIVISTAGSSSFDGTQRFIALVCECGAVIGIGGSLSRMLLAGNPRMANVVGKLSVAYIFIINALELLTVLGVFDRYTLRLFPCCIAGITRHPNGHLLLGVVMVFVAVVVLVGAAWADFRRFRRP